MNKLLSAILGCGFISILLLSSCSKPSTQNPVAEAATEAGLLPHTATTEKLGDGNRVEVTSSNPDLSHDECKKMAEFYNPYAAPGGQVVVQKPNPKAPWNGKLLPFCVDNLDAKGVTFNDDFFK